LQLGKPILVLPRRSDLGETRNDHQVATTRHFAAAGHVLAAYDEQELRVRIAELERQQPGPLLAGSASPELLSAIRGFLHGS
jgi:UDP-N-acetylglucosamine transferase subunit ALG13